MNRIIAQHFDAVEMSLIHSPAILSFDILAREISPTDGKLRFRARLQHGGLLECFQYVIVSGGEIASAKYSFHWQDRTGRLIRRWDNAPHFQGLPNAPHHIHTRDGSVIASRSVPDILDVISFIEDELV